MPPQGPSDKTLFTLVDAIKETAHVPTMSCAVGACVFCRAREALSDLMHALGFSQFAPSSPGRATKPESVDRPVEPDD